MSLTVAESAKLSTDLLLQGVYETILNEDPLAEMLEFIPAIGTAVHFNQENVAAASAWYDVGDTWAEGAPTFTEKTVTLRTVGGDADVDDFLRQSRADTNDLESIVLQLKAKSVWEEVRKKMILGSNATQSKEPDGLDVMIPATQQVTAGTNGAALTMAMMDELSDAVRGPVDFYLMSRRSRRKLSALMRAAGGGVLPTVLSAFGIPTPSWNERPVFVSDYIPDNQTQGTATDTSRVYAVHTGEDGFVGFYAGASVLQIDRIGALETKNAIRNRVKGYVAFGLLHARSCAKLVGVKD